MKSLNPSNIFLAAEPKSVMRRSAVLRAPRRLRNVLNVFVMYFICGIMPKRGPNGPLGFENGPLKVCDEQHFLEPLLWQIPL